MRPLALDAYKTRADELASGKIKALHRVSAKDVQHLDEPAVVALQDFLEHGKEFGVWKTPRKWCPSEHSNVKLNIDIRSRITYFLPEVQKSLLVGSESGATKSTAVHDLEMSRRSANAHAALNAAVLACTRYLLLLRIGPAGLGMRARQKSLDPSNIKSLAYDYIAPLFALGLKKQLDEISSQSPEANSAQRKPTIKAALLFVTARDLDDLSKFRRKKCLDEIKRMAILRERGHWEHVSPALERLQAVTPVAGPAAPANPEPTSDPHLPLPDSYVSEMGVRSLWLIEEAGPSLLKIAERMQAIWDNTRDLDIPAKSIAGRRRYALTNYLKGFEWLDRAGNLITSPPFTLRLSEKGRKHVLLQRKNAMADAPDEGFEDAEFEEVLAVACAKAPETVQWPPRGYAEVMGLISNLQLAHLFVVSMSTGARKSETLDLKRDCVQYAANNEPYAKGRTFKLVRRIEGEMREWVLPEIATRAIEQQVRLVSLAEHIGSVTPKKGSVGPAKTTGEHLWAQLGLAAHSDPKKPLHALGQALTAYAVALGMDTAPGGQNLRPHRFRKTVARIVALALTQAPKILMDVFGHASIEMTLHYILADKDLQAEIEQVSRELRVMRAKEVVQKIVDDEDAGLDSVDLGSYGGPAALMAQRAVHTHKVRLYKRGEDWGANSAFELAEILTLQGKAWQYVRPGIICTKFPGTESGPCNKSRGHVEPARCQSRCQHRLEEAFLRKDVGAIRDAIAAYVDAQAQGELLVQEQWAAQIRSQVVRFEDLKQKWLKDPTVHILMQPEHAV